MTDQLTLALAQINPVVGDLAGNVDRLLSARAEGARQGADLVIAPELSLCGYPPEDLVLKPFFQTRCDDALQHLVDATTGDGPALLIGAPRLREGRLYNTALLIEDGRILAERDKTILPNYGVFDEKRLFTPADPHGEGSSEGTGKLQGPVLFRDVRLGIMVCEDMWVPDVAETLEETGAEILIVINGSPIEADKLDQRQQIAVQRARECDRPLIYVNQVGGQDELVFDGASFIVDADRRLRAQMPFFRAGVFPTTWTRRGDGKWVCARAETVAPPAREEAIYGTLMLGLQDYVEKNGFPGVLVGLSGGIDSALCATVAVDALGPDRVWAVRMPSPYTSRASLDDAAALADAQGIRLDTVGIDTGMTALESSLAELFAGHERDEAEENIQARLRGLILMGLSNKFGPMVIATGNKSEMSVGYSTLYGDMAGGFALLKDVYKSDVYALARWRNETVPPFAKGPAGVVIPPAIIDKAPTAELRPDQKDEDSLPPYAVLDQILECLVDSDMGLDEIAAKGLDRETAKTVWAMLDRAEYKRRQAAPGVKTTRRLFGRDRRYPITNRFRRML